MAFESLEDELAQHLTKICEIQMSGEYTPRMVYQPGVGLQGESRLDKGRVVVLEDITRDQLRALATHDYLSVVTPRAHWFITATAKALTEYADDDA
ncbi:MAG: hypothetical protein V3V20_07865 [Algisphaera sp.]